MDDENLSGAFDYEREQWEQQRIEEGNERIRSYLCDHRRDVEDWHLQGFKELKPGLHV